MIARRTSFKSCILRCIIGRSTSSLSHAVGNVPPINASRARQAPLFRVNPRGEYVGNKLILPRCLSTEEKSSDKNKSTSEESPPPEVEFEDTTAPLPELDRSKYTDEVKVRMPDMGEGEGRVLKWYKQEGNIIKRGDILCDIETPDFTFGMETEDEGYAIMGKILVEAPSEPVKDGEVICILLHEAKEEKKKVE